MQLTVCNTTLDGEKISEVNLWEGGITFHTLALLVSGAFSVVATVISIFLIVFHATHYSQPGEQRHIIRILFMIPIYSLVAVLSIWIYENWVYFSVIGNCYEAFAIASFFALLCHYLADDLHLQKNYFRGIKPLKWIWGGARLWRTPRSGLTWFNIIWVGVFQYCFIRVSMTIVAVITQAAGKYCEASLSPAFAHVWVLVLEALSVTIAMYCLIQFYLQIHQDVADHSPFMKILSIKLVIFLSFWQTLVISLLTSSGAVKPSQTIGALDLKVGIPNLLIAVEMAFFSILHIWAYPWKPYALDNQESADGSPVYKSKYHGGPMGLKAYADAFNPWDMLKATGRGFRWLFVGRRRRLMDVSYMGQPGTSFTVTSATGGVTKMTAQGEIATDNEGAGGASQGSPNIYGRFPDEEGQELLSRVQSNPSLPYSLDPHNDGRPETAFYEDNHGERLYNTSSNDEDTTTLHPASLPPYPGHPDQPPHESHPAKVFEQ